MTASLASNFEPGISRQTRAVVISEQVSARAFFATLILLFIASVAATVLWSNSMPAMRGMPMPGGWTMSMAWMRMPGETWAGATASFVGMWVVMTVAMMLPSLTPMLWRYRQSAGSAREALRGRLTTLAGLGYFFIWTLFGLAVFPVGVAAAAIEMEHPALARAIPVAAGLAALIAGGLQFTEWKAHHLTFCRESPGRDSVLPARAGAAWSLGLHFGLRCGLSCANLMAILLVFGVMDSRAMALVSAAITAERLAPAGKHVARAIGAVAVGAGLLLIAAALRLE